MSPNMRAGIVFPPPTNLGEARVGTAQRQLISGYIEGFLHREHTGPEHLEELLTTLKKLVSATAGMKMDSVQILREAIEALSSGCRIA